MLGSISDVLNASTYLKVPHVNTVYCTWQMTVHNIIHNGFLSNRVIFKTTRISESSYICNQEVIFHKTHGL